MKIQVRFLTRKRVEVVFIPNWFARWLLGHKPRHGAAFRAKDQYDQTAWFWETTDRYVGSKIERLIEATPMNSTGA